MAPLLNEAALPHARKLPTENTGTKAALPDPSFVHQQGPVAKLTAF